MYTTIVLMIQLGAITTAELNEQTTSVTETVEAIELDTPRASERWTVSPAVPDAQ